MLGLMDFQLKTQADYDRIMDVWREKTVAARDTNNDELAADLSQCKEAIKKKYTIVKSKTCPRCHQPKGVGTEYCNECMFRLKGEKPVNAEEEGLYVVVNDVYVFAKRSGFQQQESPLTATLRKLVNIGDSFVTEKHPTSVKNAAKIVGINTTIRKVNLGEQDKKKMRFRVWRVDDKKPSEVNQVIKQRLDNSRRLDAAGQMVPAPAPEPPPASATD